MRKNYLFSAFAALMLAMLCGTACQEEEVKISERNYMNGYVNDNYTAYINTVYLELYGYSIRYVFEPQYK
ncbi:MAG: hypothetical protein II937_15400 [Bacteroidales bacterium]|nr:hypothetical protein [Bacteroidales bacterium]